MILTRRSTLGLAALAAFSSRTRAEYTSRGLAVHAVYELFTSQGCSSCPPADILFHTLRNEPGVLALSLPVTIWDHLGWKDTLAQTVFSGRQKGYAKARGDRQIYTPQVVVNGTTHCVGSDRKAIETALANSNLLPGVQALTPVLLEEAGRWSVHVPDSPIGRPAQPEPPQGGASMRRSAHAGSVVLVTYSREATVEIKKGENGGRTLRYGNIVRSINHIGEYTGTEATYELPERLRADSSESFAVLVQGGTEKHPGAIIGAVEAPRI